MDDPCRMCVYCGWYADGESQHYMDIGLGLCHLTAPPALALFYDVCDEYTDEDVRDE